jgi:hypothetical protein
VTARRGAAVAGLLAVLPLAACAGRRQGVEGRVVDHVTGRPVPGAVVTLSGRGWGVSNGDVVWDKESVGRAVAGDDGRFRARVGGRGVRVAAEAPGYVRYGGWMEGGEATIRLLPRTPSNPALVHGHLEVGERDGVAYGWVLAERRTTTRRDSADLFPTVGAPADVDVVLDVPGGVLLVAGETIGPVDDPLPYVEEAPAQGYTGARRVRGGETGVLVVRARDGRVAKLAANPLALGSEREAAAGTRGFRFAYVYNPAPGRDLAFKP